MRYIFIFIGSFFSTVFKLVMFLAAIAVILVVFVVLNGMGMVPNIEQAMQQGVEQVQSLGDRFS